MPLPEPILDGDTFFKGVNARLNPGQLEAGFVASAINKRFVNGVVETRPGIKKMPWSNCLTQAYDDNANTGSGYGTGTYVMYSGRKVDTSSGVAFSNVAVSNNTTSDGTVELSTNGGPASNTKGPYFKVVNSPVAAGLNPVNSSNALNTNWEDAGHRIFGYGLTRTVYGTGIFRDPSGTEYLIVATSDGVFATREGLQSVELGLPASETIANDVFFVQCFNVVIMMRGADQEPLVMKAIATGFETITQEDTDTEIDENDSDGTEQIPNADSAIFFGNRLLVPHSSCCV